MKLTECNKCKELTPAQLKQVGGGNFLVGYIGGKALDILLTQAWNTHDLFQNSDLRLPYNRL